MRETSLFSRWLLGVKKSKTVSLLLVLLVFALAVLLTTCSGAGEETGGFTLVSGSGTVSVNLAGAEEDYVERTFYYGTASTGTPIGGEESILSNDMLMTINNGVDDIVFTGGSVLEVGGFIDANGNGATSFYMADDNDWLASKPVTVSGNETVVLNYPGDFTLVTGSGTVSVNLADAGSFAGKTFYCGTISTGSPIGSSTLIDGDDVVTLKEGETDIVFTGGLVMEVGGFIDVNDNGTDSYMADDGDWLASKPVTVSGNETVVLNYPGDFTLVTGSGTVSVNLQDAFSSHAGKSFYYGTRSTGTPLGGQETIDSNGMLLAIADDGPAIEFTGGSELTVGGFIDVNGNGDLFQMADDGDYQASRTVTVAGDTVVTLTY